MTSGRDITSIGRSFSKTDLFGIFQAKDVQRHPNTDRSHNCLKSSKSAKLFMFSDRGERKPSRRSVSSDVLILWALDTSGSYQTIVDL